MKIKNIQELNFKYEIIILIFVMYVLYKYILKNNKENKLILNTKLIIIKKINIIFFKKIKINWKPYFKKDGYSGLFAETTLWK